MSLTIYESTGDYKNLKGAIMVSLIQKYKIIYGSETMNAAKFANKLTNKYLENNLEAKCICASMYDVDELCEEKDILIIIISTFYDGKPPKNAENFYESILELDNDFRIDRNYLGELKYSIFGLGSSAYKKDFNIVARKLNQSFKSLGAKRLFRTGYGDEYNDMEIYFDKWCSQLLHHNENLAHSEEDEEVDIEDIYTDSPVMLTSTLRRNLTKQGYKLVGTHSAVKMCRWTKSMLKGRGGCYKHTFYGLNSHRCMEATPSLACANKCVFCWRHYTNPVSTEWKWEHDDPTKIVDGLLQEHKSMIYQMKTAPGVIPERYLEGSDVKHCALSLVGEPIMYPQINSLISLLNEKGISSFLVTNAQFPDLLLELEKVTQLYLSIDAADKSTLKSIDRPLFEDFWERFLKCIEIMKNRRERTVFRLTLVKDKNSGNPSDYANLIKSGTPDFVEIKGVTFCGYKDEATMSMKNVPFHNEVEAFSQELVSLVGDYDIACVHEHTCSVLIANKKFKISNVWHTWIDYEKYILLVNSKVEFDALDYSLPTPDWALVGSFTAGFDPNENRHYRNKLKTSKTTAEDCECI